MSNQNPTDGSAEGPPPGDGALGGGPSGESQEREVFLLDLLLVLVRNKGLIFQTVLVFGLLGGAYALLAADEFTSEAHVVREAQGERGGLPGGLSSGALSGLGISLGGASGGLGPSAYPSVLESREVRLAVARDTFPFPDVERPMTFVEYANRPPGLWSRFLDYTIWLPWTASNAVIGMVSADSSTASGAVGTEEATVPSKEEIRGAKAVEGLVSSTIESETGLMIVSVTIGDPQLAADLSTSFVDHLTARVREVRTEKVRERLGFVEERFQEVETELEAAESRLAQFLERNQNPTTATLQFQQDRLQRQVGFKEQLYSELQSQLTQTRLDLQRRQPVVTVVERPVPPTSPSGPNRMLYFLASIILGGGAGVALVFGRTFLTNWAEQSEEGRAKVQELRENLIPRRLRGDEGDPLEKPDAVGSPKSS